MAKQDLLEGRKLVAEKSKTLYQQLAMAIAFGIEDGLDEFSGIK